MQTRTVAVGSTDLPHQYVVAMDRLGPLLWTIDNGRTLRPLMQAPKVSRYAYVSEELPRLVSQVDKSVLFIEEELSGVGLHPSLKADPISRRVVHEFPVRVRPVLDELANLVEKHPTVETGYWLGETDFSEHMQLVKPLLQ